MTLLPRLIPTVQILKGCVVKTRLHKSPRYIGHPANTIRMFNEMNVDEIVVLDMGRKFAHSRIRDLETLKSMSAEAFVPLSIGGGIETLDEAKLLISLGFEKVVIGSAARRDPALLQRIADVFGAQAVVLALDCAYINGRWRSVEWHRRNVSLPVEDLLTRYEWMSVGEVLLTDVTREGTRLGLDTSIICLVAELAPVPVIVNGGATGASDLSIALKAGGSALGLGDSMVRLQGSNSVLVHMSAGNSHGAHEPL